MMTVKKHTAVMKFSFFCLGPRPTVHVVLIAIFAVQFFKNGLNVPLIKEARVDTC